MSSEEGLIVLLFFGGLILWGIAYGTYDDYRNSAKWAERRDIKQCEKLLHKRKCAVKKAKKEIAERKLRIKSGKVIEKKEINT